MAELKPCKCGERPGRVWKAGQWWVAHFCFANYHYIETSVDAWNKRSKLWQR